VLILSATAFQRMRREQAAKAQAEKNNEKKEVKKSPEKER
jgi:hypothetical protein